LINVASKNVLDDIQLSLSMGYSLYSSTYILKVVSEKKRY
jgi:hypothetical protein